MNSHNDLDQLFGDYVANELTPLRGQAGRAFAREVLTPMREQLARQRRQRRWRLAGQSSCSLAASMALGFFVPMWLSSGPAATGTLTGGRPFLVDYEEHVPAPDEASATLPARH